MAEIKTREKRQGIKVLDRTAEIGGQVREKALRAKDTAAQLTDDRQESPNDYAAERVQEGGRQLAGDAADLLVRQGKKLVRSARVKRGGSDGSEAASEPDDSGEGVSSPEPDTTPAAEPEQRGAPIEPDHEPYYEPAPDQPESFSQQVTREYPSPRHELPDDDFGIKTRETAQSQLPPKQRSTAPEPEEIRPRIKTRDSAGAPANAEQQSVQPAETARIAGLHSAEQRQFSKGAERPAPHESGLTVEADNTAAPILSAPRQAAVRNAESVQGHTLSEPISANESAVLPRYTAQETPAVELEVSKPTPVNHSSQPVYLLYDMPEELPQAPNGETRFPAGRVNEVKSKDRLESVSQSHEGAEEKGRQFAVRTAQRKAATQGNGPAAAEIPVRRDPVPDPLISSEPAVEKETPWIRTKELVEAAKQKSPKEIRTKEKADVRSEQSPVYTEQGRQLAVQSAAQRKEASRQRETAEAPSFPGASAESGSLVLREPSAEKPATGDDRFSDRMPAVRVKPAEPEIGRNHNAEPKLSEMPASPEPFVADSRPRIKTAERKPVRTKETPWIRTADHPTDRTIPNETADRTAPRTLRRSIRTRERQTETFMRGNQNEQTTPTLRRTQFPRGERSAPRTAEHPEQKPIKTAERVQRSIKQSARSSGKRSVKTAQRSVKTSRQAVKTAEQTGRAAAKTAQKSAQATAKAAQKTAAAARATAHAAAVAIKAASEAAAAAAKAISEAAKALVALIAEGGGVAALVIVIICLIGLIVGSSFGIFFSGSSGTSGGETITDAVQEINEAYDETIEAILDDVDYDDLVQTGTHAVWREVLAVYAVKVSTDSDNPQDAASMTDEKKALLSSVFWAMTTVTHRTETYTETETVEVEGEDGEVTEEEVEVEKTRLYVTVNHKTAAEIAAVYNFTADQLAQLNELLSNENSLLWSALLYGIASSDDAIVTVALSQVGNIGGQPYWSWYGYSSRVEWCAIFVSWCANECGYLDSGIIPRFEGCIWGVSWFKNRGQWIDGSAEPAPGMLIFFDWNDPNGSAGPQDGLADHVGIVQKVEDGYVYTIEGNSGDQCRSRRYPVGFSQILGYGMPEYD